MNESGVNLFMVACQSMLVESGNSHFCNPTLEIQYGGGITARYEADTGVYEYEDMQYIHIYIIISTSPPSIAIARHLIVRLDNTLVNQNARRRRPIAVSNMRNSI